jgi:hypothetical protein
VVAAVAGKLAAAGHGQTHKYQDWPIVAHWPAVAQDSSEKSVRTLQHADYYIISASPGHAICVLAAAVVPEFRHLHL